MVLCVSAVLPLVTTGYCSVAQMNHSAFTYSPVDMVRITSRFWLLQSCHKHLEACLYAVLDLICLRSEISDRTSAYFAL